MGLFSWWPFGRKHKAAPAADTAVEDWEGEQPPDENEKPEDFPPVPQAQADAEDAEAAQEAARPDSSLARGALSLGEPPEWPGIYRIRYRGPSRRIMYIGITSNLKNRKKQHTNNGHHYVRLHDFYWQKARLGTTGRLLIDAEERQIDKHSGSPFTKRRLGRPLG
jgi:hypothetical protein